MAFRSVFGGLVRNVTMRDEHWAHRLLSADRVPSPPTVSEVRSSIRWWSLSEEFVLLGSVSRDGIRSVDVPRESSRHRSLPRFHRRQALPHGIPRQGGTFDIGRCERITRLANLRRLCARFDRARSPALCARSDRPRSWIRVSMRWTPRPSTCASLYFRRRSFANTNPL